MIAVPKLVAAALALAVAASARGDRPPEIRTGIASGDSLGGFVLPTEPGTWPVSLKAVSASLWKVGSTQRLYLRERVEVSLGSYEFVADRAVLWIERIPSAKLVWLDEGSHFAHVDAVDHFLPPVSAFLA